jgi:hypothetical protein
VSSKIDEIAAELTGSFVTKLQEQIAKQVQADVMRKLGQIDLNETVVKEVSRLVKLDSVMLSGDRIIGGIIKNFGSTGIQDDATDCRITILDDNTVVENNLVVSSVEVKGNLTVDGDLILTGEIPSDSPFYKDLVQHAAGLLKLSMDKEFFLQYANLLFDQVQKEGIDTSKLTLNGKEVIVGNRIGRSITDSNLQRLGELRELIVRGATSLANNSLYVQNGRVGINTEEPSCALSVWDDGCEVTVRKLRKDVSVVGSLREQRVVLSANNKENLTLEIDGSVTVDRLNVGDTQIGSTATRPTHNEKPGLILFNSNPQIGHPIFWVSLGGARWVDGPLVS